MVWFRGHLLGCVLFVVVLLLKGFKRIWHRIRLHILVWFRLVVSVWPVPGQPVHSRRILIIYLTKVWSCSSSNPQWGRVWCTRNPCICQEGPDQEFHSPWQAPNHAPWDRDHVGEEVESPCLPKISPPCSPALDPSSEVEQVVPPSALEGEEDELEEGFQAAWSVWSVFFIVVNFVLFVIFLLLYLVVAGVIGLLVTGLGSG